MDNRLPLQGLDQEAVVAQLEAARVDDVKWRDGRLGLYVHSGGDDVVEVARDAYCRFFSENALGPSAFPSLARFERDVIDWTASLLNGGDDATGNVSSGGSESIFLAMKSIRDWAKASGRGGEQPRVIMPYSAHPAFNKAAHWLQMNVTRTALGPDLRCNMNALAAALDHDTVAIVGSAPGFPHGVVDPIEDIAEIACAHDLWLHVDACVGGFILPFARRLGYAIPQFDFSIAPVRSISADLHKYGFAAKGASTIIYRSPDEHQHQSFDFDQWPRGRYLAPTIAGTRPGGALAAAWAVMRYLGESGYLRIAREVMGARDALWRGIDAIDGLHVWSNPEGPIITYGSDSLAIFVVAEAMTERGWFVTRGLEPPCIHLGMLSAIHVPIVENYLADLAAAVDEAKAGRALSGATQVTYGG